MGFLPLDQELQPPGANPAGQSLHLRLQGKNNARTPGEFGLTGGFLRWKTLATQGFNGSVQGCPHFPFQNPPEQETPLGVPFVL